MEGILPLLFWGGLIFLMMRFGCGAHMFGHGHGRGRKHDHAGQSRSSAADAQPKDQEGLVWTAPETDTDPVCGKEVVTAGAKSSVHNGWVYYFCSRECRDMFETAPEPYLGAKAPGSPQSPVPGLEHHPEKHRSHA